MTVSRSLLQRLFRRDESEAIRIVPDSRDDTPVPPASAAFHTSLEEDVPASPLDGMHAEDGGLPEQILTEEARPAELSAAAPPERAQRFVPEMLVEEDSPWPALVEPMSSAQRRALDFPQASFRDLFREEIPPSPEFRAVADPKAETRVMADAAESRSPEPEFVARRIETTGPPAAEEKLQTPAQEPVRAVAPAVIAEPAPTAAPVRPLSFQELMGLSQADGEAGLPEESADLGAVATAGPAQAGPAQEGQAADFGAVREQAADVSPAAEPGRGISGSRGAEPVVPAGPLDPIPPLRPGESGWGQRVSHARSAAAYDPWDSRLDIPRATGRAASSVAPERSSGNSVPTPEAEERDVVLTRQWGLLSRFQQSRGIGSGIRRVAVLDEPKPDEQRPGYRDDGEGQGR